MSDNKRKPTVSTNNPNSKKAKINVYRSNWFKAIFDYVNETQVEILNLGGQELMKEEVEALLNILPDTQVTELSLRFNSLESSLVDLAPLLIKTKIRKLNISNSCFTKQFLIRLAKVLKDSEITDLHIVNSTVVGSFDLFEACTFISHLRKSKLTRLNTDSLHFVCLLIKNASFCREFFTSPVTFLNLRGISSDDLILLSSNLGQNSVTDLALSFTTINSKALQELSQRLANTKIEKLHFGRSSLKDAHLDTLAQGFVNSQLNDLDLRGNDLTSLSRLFAKLQGTRITTLNCSENLSLRNETLIPTNSFQCCSLTSLNLSRCELSDELGEALMESLRLSNVKTLNVSVNHFGLLTVRKFVENVKDFNLIDLDISHNRLPLDGFFTLGGCLKESKLARINVSDFNRKLSEEGVTAATDGDLLTFLELTKGSSVSQIRMNGYPYTWNCSSMYESNMLENTTFSELYLSASNIQNGVSEVVSYLKFSALTHLDLSRNSITDDGIGALMECLKVTEIRRLNLSSNSITSQGAGIIALSLKETNLLCLDLSLNQIGDHGMEILAESVENLFITELDVSFNPGKKFLLVEKVLWENRIPVHKLVTIFRQLAPKTNNEFCFDPTSDDLDVGAFLEKCMWFYKTIINNPRAINVLLDEKIVPLSREQIFKLVFEEFPRQFTSFIVCKIEADLTERLRILEKAEESELTAVVESFLLHRPVFMINKRQGILHPYVYKLLLKYKQPVCNLDIEPDGLSRIIKYFTEHANVEGAQDVINLLQAARIL